MVVQDYKFRFAVLAGIKVQSRKALYYSQNNISTVEIIPGQPHVAYMQEI